MKSILLILSVVFFSCNSGVKTESNKEVKEIKSEVKPNRKKTFSEIIQKIKLKNLPIIDALNFDNFIKVKKFNSEEIKRLQLRKIYSEIDNERYDFKIFPSYKIDLSKKFHSIVISILKSNSEIESILINYSLNGEIIDYKVISYGSCLKLA